MRGFLTAIWVLCALSAVAQPRTSVTLTKGWEFHRGDKGAGGEWTKVEVPHDWAIYGPFDRTNDLQSVAIVQNGEREESIKTGRTGGLPYIGRGQYRLQLPIAVSGERCYTLLFDGAMSGAQVFVNGTKCGEWGYGYNSFEVDITRAAKEGDNLIEVELENLPQSSRWYPGAGLYRNVHLITTERVHVPVWGTQLTTPYVGADYASVRLRTELANLPDGDTVRMATVIRDNAGHVVASKEETRRVHSPMPFEQHFTVERPQLWSPESPALYTAESKIYHKGRLTDEYTTRFGIRTIEMRADKGFFLNGKRRKFRGVCLHHDLGPLGAAVNSAAIRQRLAMLRDMGCDAIRTTHNMPAPELVELCDEMGFMLVVESFDEWDEAKCDNGYHRLFAQWAERDMVNMLRHYRNNASVVMWSTGNEVPTQWTAGGRDVAARLQEICHREDPTRPVTCGMDQIGCVLDNGFAAVPDIPGFNYKVPYYPAAYDKLPQNLILGSETASTVSSRGVYHFPVREGADILDADHQCSSYDTEYCSWSNIPDDDLAADDTLPYLIGQFVWTGFDYLGEPSPYDTDAWPNHSSMYGIIDLASLPKDRYWLYRSVWNRAEPTLHILPHWTWHGREGETTPVFVYTSYPSAELFLNGRSLGVRRKRTEGNVKERYRLMWDDVRYEPGELRVVAFDDKGCVAAQKSIRTAGKPYQLEAVADRSVIAADGSDLAYIEVRVVDRNGTVVPTDGREVSFKVTGAGSFAAAANGDPTSLDAFHLPRMHLFGGELTAIVRAGEQSGEIVFEASAKGVQKATIRIKTK